MRCFAFAFAFFFVVLAFALVSSRDASASAAAAANERIVSAAQAAAQAAVLPLTRPNGPRTNKCHKFVLYKQCSSPWANDQLGTSPYDTVCSAGCAMSDVAMSLATYGATINGQAVNPGSLNSWLTKNNGYADQDLIIWDSVDSFGVMEFVEEVKSLSKDQLGKYVSECYPVIANVRNGTHWVLIVGATSNPNVWEVNDPGFNQQTYDYDTMLEFVVYKPMPGGSINIIEGSQEHPHQPAPAYLEKASFYSNE